MGASARTTEISGLMSRAIDRLNRGTGVSRPTPLIETASIKTFLKSPRGLALGFWCMNEAWKRFAPQQGDVFWVDASEWEKNNPKDWCKVNSVVNCHTHYIQPGHSKKGTHWGLQYQAGAHHHWWLFPEAFRLNVNYNASALPASPRYSVRAELTMADDLHTRERFVAHTLETYKATSKKYALFLMPAPGNAGRDMDGSDFDAASYEDMLLTAAQLNQSVGNKKICHVVGVIKNNMSPSTNPSIPSNPSRIWKIYPSGQNWNSNGQDWLVNQLPSVIDQLPKQANRHHTICIHWWDKAEKPMEELPNVANDHKHVSFVIFHACFPHYERLARVLESTDNVYAEIGGTFANQILGGYGQDEGWDGNGEPVPPDPLPSSHAGPAAARHMIKTLRGQSHQNDAKIVWGTDAIWHGSATWQIEAFKRLILTDHDPGRPVKKRLAEEREFKGKVLFHNLARAFSIVPEL